MQAHHRVVIGSRCLEAIGPTNFVGIRDGIAIFEEYIIGEHVLPDGVPARGNNGEKLTKVTFRIVGGRQNQEHHWVV